jgi:hypothetical protein
MVVDKNRVHCVFHHVGLAIDFRTLIGGLHRLAIFILALVGDLGCLGFPFHERARTNWHIFDVPGIADRLDLIPQAHSTGLRYFSRIGARSCAEVTKCQEPKKQIKDDYRRPKLCRAEAARAPFLTTSWILRAMVCIAGSPPATAAGTGDIRSVPTLAQQKERPDFRRDPLRAGCGGVGISLSAGHLGRYRRSRCGHKAAKFKTVWKRNRIITRRNTLHKSCTLPDSLYNFGLTDSSIRRD